MKRRPRFVPTKARRWIVPGAAVEHQKMQRLLYCNLELEDRRSLTWLERDFQRAVVRYITVKHRDVIDLCFHVPLELLRRDDNTAGMFKALGARAGVADLIMLVPRGAYHGFVMELKVPPRRPSADQCDFLKAARAQRYAACWTDSPATAYALIDAYLALPERALLAELQPPPIEETPNELRRARQKANRDRPRSTEHAGNGHAVADGAARRDQSR